MGVRRHPALPLFLAGALLLGCDAASFDPEWVRERTPLPFCGEIAEEDIGGQADRASVRCMIDAWEAGTGGERITHGRTGPGAPMTSMERVHPDGTIEMFLDLRADLPGDDTWERFVCEDLSVDPDGTTYTIGGCTMPPVP